jgi:hypothetical protein
MGGEGLPVLEAGATALLGELDRVLQGWAADVGGSAIITPALLDVASLSRLNVYDNFPHQALVAAPLDLSVRPPGTLTGEIDQFPVDELEPARLALPTAACFGVYLHFAGRRLADRTVVTVLGRCFRREGHYQDLRRLLSFHMREIVAIGSQEFVREHLAEFDGRIARFAESLGLVTDRQAASDPFYDRGGQRALMQKLSPVKHEYLVDDLAIASLNTHRNFFGEKCGITLVGTGEPVFTGCVAFGLERWLSVLHERFGDWESAIDAVSRAAAGHAVERMAR